MANKTYWKDVWRAITGTKGRFLSIFLLLFLGTFVLVGLKSAIPDMQAKGKAYFDTYQTMDLTVMADYGLSEADQQELDKLAGARVEYGYQADATIKDTVKAVRLFSYQKDQEISRYELVAGQLPQTKTEIALAASYQSDYQIGDSFTVETDNTALAEKAYRVTGFVHSSEIISQENLGNATAGDGQLDGYGLVLPAAFDADVYGLARIRFDDLERLNPFGSRYAAILAEKQASLEEMLADNGAARLAKLKADGQAKVDQAQAKIAKGEADLTSQERQLEQARSYLPAQTLAEAEKKIASAKNQLAASKADLAAAREDLAALTEPGYHVYNRETLPVGTGYLGFTASMTGIETVSNIFPVVLYFVAALVTFTTMTRFVDEERTNSGLFQALGYSRSAIVRKFVLYGLAASLTGTVLGSLAGTYFLPRVISRVSMGQLTLGEINPLIQWPYVGLAFALALVSAVLPAYLIASRELASRPAELLLAKPPVAGSKIFLERLGFIWRRLSFTHKVTARNIFRYKQRMFMTIFGVAGSVALLFAGLGIRSSISGVLASQFEESLTYDLRLLEDTGISSADRANLTQLLDQDRIAKREGIYSETVDQTIEGLTDKQTVTLMAADNAAFSSLVRLSTQDGQPIQLSDQGAVLSQKLASHYGVKQGDRFTYETADGDKRELTVAAVSNIYVGHFIFMNRSYYETAFKQELRVNSYLIALKDASPKAISALAAELLDKDGVRAVLQNGGLISTLETVVTSLNGVMLILVLLSILLALVILYNLTTINVAERIRELSTIKILGFFNREVTLYIYRETILLSLVGIALGLGSGFALHRFIINRIGSDLIAFEQQVGWDIYLIPVAAVVSILALLGWVVNRRLKRLNMLEALKSVD